MAAAARLRKKNFRKPDKVPRTYDRKTFRLDGCMDMDISFADKTMTTTVYIKMDAHDQLLLSEGVCRQLGIVSYHPSIIKPEKAKKMAKSSAIVPTVRVSLVQSLRLPPSHGALVSVELEGDPDDLKQPLIVLNHEDVERETGLTVEDVVITAPENGVAKLIVTNCSGFTQSVPRGTYLGEAEVAEVLATVEPDKNEPSSAEAVTVKRTTFSSEAWRREKLMETLELPDLPPPDLRLLREFLADHHDVFSLEDGERGETDLMDMEIDTGDASPRKQAPRRMPFVVRQEVAKQIKDMLSNQVIQPSRSPWSSPVVMVRKKDGSHRSV